MGAQRTVRVSPTSFGLLEMQSLSALSGFDPHLCLARARHLPLLV